MIKKILHAKLGWISQILREKKPDVKEYILYNSMFIKLIEHAN